MHSSRLSAQEVGSRSGRGAALRGVWPTLPVAGAPHLGLALPRTRAAAPMPRSRAAARRRGRRKARGREWGPVGVSGGASGVGTVRRDAESTRPNNSFHCGPNLNEISIDHAEGHRDPGGAGRRRDPTPRHATEALGLPLWPLPLGLCDQRGRGWQGLAGGAVGCGIGARGGGPSGQVCPHACSRGPAWPAAWPSRAWVSLIKQTTRLGQGFAAQLAAGRGRDGIQSSGSPLGAGVRAHPRCSALLRVRPGWARARWVEQA